MWGRPAGQGQVQGRWSSRGGQGRGIGQGGLFGVCSSKPSYEMRCILGPVRSRGPSGASAGVFRAETNLLFHGLPPVLFAWDLETGVCGLRLFCHLWKTGVGGAPTPRSHA